MQCDDVDVDAERVRLPDNPGHVRAAAGELLPPAAPAGADDDLGDLVLLGEADDGPGRIVVLDLVPAGADIGGELLQFPDGRAVRGPGRVAGGHVHHVQVRL